jgi:outer membrane protein assembly factor BamA
MENWFGGLQYLMLDTETTIDLPALDPRLPKIRGSIVVASLGPIISFDSRDDNYYPQRGSTFEILWNDYRDTWGSNYDYSKLGLSISHYQPLNMDFVLALNAKFDSSYGDVPFFDLPSLQMQGFAMGKYRDKYTLSTHVEGRYKFHPRWGGNLFVESGWYGAERNELFSGQTIISYGGGIRWQVEADKKIHLGAEVAFSGEDQAFYIRVGEKF